MSSKITPKPLSIMVHSMEGAGHINACIGLAQELHRRGHRVTFVVAADLKGRFIREGFGEILLHSKQSVNKDSEEKKSQGVPSSKEDNNNNPYRPFAEKVHRAGLITGIKPLEKLKCHISGANGFIEVIRNALIEFDSQLEEAINRLRPDVIVLAQFLIPPAIARSSVPLVNIVPFNPIGLFCSPRKIPPFFSGISVHSDPSTWEEFHHFQQNIYLPEFRANQRLLNEACGYHPKEKPLDPNRSYFLMSNQLNIYGFPRELDYTDLVPAPPTALRIDGFCRSETEQEKATVLELPEHFQPDKRGNRKLIYLSLGSMGAINVPLMKRLLKILSTLTPHLYIVSKGPAADQYELPSPNCWGASFLPQTKVLPLVDLVITHGGNNTLTETFAMAKPMVVLPLFSDQYDNATRMQDKGFGIRLDPFIFEDQELVRAVEKLLGDTELQRRLQRAAERIRTDRSKEKACEAIEAIVAN